jgi:hypothetical protein
MTTPEPTVRATRYLVTCVPEHRDPGGYRGVTIEYRGDDDTLCLGTDGRWDRERQSTDRSEEWLASHRFDLATARRLAVEQAKDLIQPSKDRAVHLGGGANAEDCPACHGTNPPYPFICPGPAALPAV